MDNQNNPAPAVDEDGYVGDPIQIVNEFAQVEIQKVKTKKGERLEIRSPKLGYSIRLDAIDLESLSWQEPEKFDELLEEPYGPSDEH
jgi:hypothetical protein